MTNASAPFAAQVITCVAPAWPALLSPQMGLVGRAISSGLASLAIFDLRDFGVGPHRNVDDRPYGGGAGMVLAAPPLLAAIAAARRKAPGPVVILAPRGPTFDQAQAQRWAKGPGLTLVCGRYEGIDERVYAAADCCLSIGDYVLSGGDPAALCVLDAVLRLRSGTLGNAASTAGESFADSLLQHPQYTRPAEVAGAAVPPVLMGGDHSRVQAWRRRQQLALTAAMRPDLWRRYQQGQAGEGDQGAGQA